MSEACWLWLLKDDFRWNVWDSPSACFFARFLAALHLSRACSLSLALLAAASLDLASLLSRLVRIWPEKLYIINKTKLNATYRKVWNGQVVILESRKKYLTEMNKYHIFML